jgi:hypothetical protein
MTKDEELAFDLALEALESQVANVYDTESNAFKKCAPAITALKKVRSAQPAPVQEPVAWGWAILHSDGTHAFIRPRIADFFGSIQEREPFTSEYAKHADREWAGLAPHTIVTLYTTPPAAPVQEPVAYFVNCTHCGAEKKIEMGNHHPWCFCGSDSFDWANSRDDLEPATPVQEPVAWIRGSGLEMLKLENGGVATVYASEAMSNHSSPLYTTPPADMKTLQAVSDEYNAWIKHHAAGHSYDDFLQAKLKEENK